MKPFFSIIIPVYNVAPYLRECLDSVLAQTFNDWEAICVDDGSTDGSGAILDEYAAKDKRFKITHQENQGVGNARNVALENVSGLWLMFLDSDDIYHPNALQSCQRASIDYPEAEVIKFNRIDFDDGYQCEWDNRIDYDKSKLESFRYTVSRESYSGAFFGGAYLFAPIKHIRFKSFPVGEDRLWLAEVVDKISEGVKLDFPLYGYRQRQSSVMHQKWDVYKFNAEIGWRVAMLHVWTHSVKQIDYAILRSSASIMTEYMSHVYFSMDQKARREVFNTWLLAIKEYSNFGPMPTYFKIIMGFNALIKSQCLIWATCWVPYFFKRHGIHR